MNPTAKEIVAKIAKATDFFATLFNLPVDRFRAHAWAETTWNSEGTNTHVVSGDGGVGLWQVESGVHPFASDPAAFDIWVSTAWAAWFLAGLYRETGDWDLASKAYNGSGPEADAYAQKIKLFMATKPWERLLP